MFRVGIIGVGNMGSLHLANIIGGKVENAKLTAICDIDEAKLAKHKDKLGEEVLYFQNSSELIASGAVDGIVIATPHYYHPIIAMEAFAAGIHVFCEKPAGVFTKNVREMNEAAKQSGKVFAINFVNRTSGTFQKLKEMIDGGELGKIKRINWIITNWYRSQSYFNSAGWRATWAGEGGGTMINQNPHQLDLWQWIIGMPKRIRAFCYFGKNRDIEVEDEATAYMEYENGAVGIYTTTVSEFPGTNRLEIAGDRGKIVLENDKITFFRTLVSEEEFNRTENKPFGPIPMEVLDIPHGPHDLRAGQAQMLANWVDAAENGTPLIAPGYEGIKSLSMSNAMYLSTWNDDWVELPIDEDEYYQRLSEKVKTSRFEKKATDRSDADMRRSFN